MRIKFVIIFLLCFFVINIQAKNVQLQPPPSTIKLKVKPPETFNDALKRVADFLILDSILPPVIDRDNVKKQLYGNFKKKVDNYIKQNQINTKELSQFIYKKLNNKKEKLDTIKDEVYSILIKKGKKLKKIEKNNKIEYMILIILLLLLGCVFFIFKKGIFTQGKY